MFQISIDGDVGEALFIQVAPNTYSYMAFQISFDGDTDTDDGEVADALFIRVAAIFSDIHIVISGLSDFL